MMLQDCPPFRDMHEYIQLVAGATLTAVDALKDDVCDIAICWDGGRLWHTFASDGLYLILISRHHAQKSKASGFCYVADCILAILSLKRPVPSVPMRRPRVMYVDLDLHFSDAVSQAFYNASSTASSQILVHCFLGFSRAFITAFRRCLSIIHPQVFSLPLRSRAYPTLTTPRSIHSPCQYP